MRTGFHWFGIALAFIAAASTPAGSEEAVLSKEAAEAQQKADSFKSYKTDFTLEAKEEDGKLFVLKGKLLYQKPGRRRLEIREGEATETTQLLVSDGAVEWQYYPQGNAVYKINNPPESPGPHRPFSETRPETIRFLDRVETDRGGLLRFEAEPLPASVEGAPVPVKKMRLELGEKDGMLRQMTMLDEKGEVVLTQKLTGLEVDVPIPEESFRFTPPEGASVTELPPAPPAG